MGSQYFLRGFFEEINGDQYYFDVNINERDYIEYFRKIITEFLKNKIEISKRKNFSKFIRIEFIKEYQTVMMVKSFNELIDKNRISIEYIENINWMKLSKEELSFYIINNFGKISLLADSDLKQKMINVSKHVNLADEKMKPYKYFDIIVSNLENTQDSELLKKSKYFTPVKFRGY
jgi:hypothetical protein